ncbi:Zn(2)-C6 fungal-type domain-containing protein [Fusarium keratoplasticum]|uniref:Zn(2)-C6 fungal-type domain-containing protein n=1 Tax=Fusarium keratoplasticum TaxID=1328300 RepID=A0ACC0RCG2_9HYPO|nr:Zn(2)-C6 fungal-type domain-containing protein [Fusarium keratoplasticum]KAI8683796.1 Zn(2)-C6 fungal-type domain-containing protein [Fusarium keratoplasticum]
MTPSGDAKKAAGKDVGDIMGQENVAPKSQPARQPSKQQVRHRASVACASCRDRRIRCVVPKDQTTCTACQKTGAECIIKNDDERRRPISKAYMSSLSDRISMLEGMLLEKGVVPPPASHPPKSRHEPSGGQPEDTVPAASNQSSLPKPERASPWHSIPSPSDSRNEDYMAAGSDHDDGNLSTIIKEESPIRILDPQQEDIIHRLLSTKGNLSFDQISGGLRFFGPTANSHVYAGSSDHYDTREPPEQVRQAEGIIRSLDPETHDYLVDHFFQYYNSAIQIIDREAFEADRQSPYPKFYSHFLHVTILAMGYRSADMDREDMRRITLRRRESTLHREAKAMLDSELERPGGIPSVQALLLLGDLECGVGRDNTGWMYSGMANRLAFDIGLHLDCTSKMSEQDTKIRNMAMQACVIYDRYWGLFLGRPLAIKSQDVDLLSNRFSQLISIGLDPPKQDMTSEIYEQLIELMELAGRIVEIRDLTGSSRGSSAGEAEENRYLQVVNLDRQLQNWYRRLPERLSWKPSNLKTAPYSFFLLHQQYHVTMILLHQPWAKYGSITGDGASTGSHSSPKSDHTASTDDFGHHLGSIVADASLGIGCTPRLGNESRTSLSRSICTQQAIRVARIFWQHRQRFDGRKIFVTGMQHAGAAAIALIAALTYQRNEPDRRTYVGYLEILSDAVGDMSYAYHPASRMDNLLKAVLDQIRNSMAESAQSPKDSTSYKSASSVADSGTSGFSIPSDLPSSTIPLRREAADPELGKPVKKRRPTNSRESSEYAPPRPPYSAVSTQPPPKADKVQSFSYGPTQQHQPQFDSLLFSMGMNDPSGQLDLGFVGGAAIDMGPNGDASGGLLGRPGAMDLGIPSSNSWNLSTMQHAQGLVSYDTPIDWTSGTAGLSASSVLNQSAALSSGIMSGAPAFGSIKDEGRSASDRKGVDAMGMKMSTIDTSWMGGGDMSSASPAGLGNLVQNANKTSQGDDGSQRNHSLDFFSFS